MSTDARNAIIDGLYRHGFFKGGKTPLIADAILSALAAAGLKVLAREPTEAMLSPHALDMATVHETHGMKNRCEQVWRAMWDDAK